ARVGAQGGLAGLVGGVLISDPDRVAHSVARPVYGNPPAWRRDPGLFPRELSRQPDVPRDQGSFAVWSVCNRHDLVCDPSDTPLHESLDLARGYLHARALRTVVQQAWSQLALWPVPTPRRQVLTGAVGRAVRDQLSVAPGTHGQVAWTEAV